MVFQEQTERDLTFKRARWIGTVLNTFWALFFAIIEIQSQTWSGGGGDNFWGTAGNFSATPTSGGTGALVFAGSTRLTPNDDLATYNASSITFNAGAGAFTLGGNGINLSGSITNNSSNTQTINQNLTLTATSNILGQNAGITLGGAVTGAFNLNNGRAGTVTTFTGSGSSFNILNVQRGTVTFANGSGVTLNGTNTWGSLASENAVVNINSGASINVTSGAVHLGTAISPSTNIATLNQTGGTFSLNGSTQLILAQGSGSTAAYNLSGGTTTVNGSFRNGNNGTSTLTMSGTGALILNSSINRLVENGAGTIIMNGGTFNSGTNSLDLQSSGSASSTGEIDFNGGVFAVGQFTKSSTTGTTLLKFNGGTLQATQSTATFLTGTALTNVTATVQSGGAIVDTNGFNITIGANLLHDSALGAALDGGLIKNGSGTLTLIGANTATGLASINNGTLVMGTNSGGNWAGGVTVNSGGTLMGIGTITGAVTINSGGIYSPGNSPGIQTIGSLTLNPGSNTIFEIDGASAGNGSGFHDQILVTGAATINGGTITPQTIFSGSSGFTPTAGQTFTVISAGSLTGQFTTVDNTGNPSGLTFIPQYTGTSVILLTTMSNLNSNPLLNLNPIQIAVARSLDQIRPSFINSTPGHVMSDAEKIYQNLWRLTPAQTPDAISQMSPLRLHIIPKLSEGMGVQVLNQVSHQLDLRRNFNPAMGNLSIYDRNGQTVYEPVATMGTDSLFVKRRPPEKLSFFASINGEQGEVSPSEFRTDYEYWSATAVYGANYALSSDWNIGIFTSYGHTDTSIGGSGGKIFYDNGKIGSYLAWNAKDWFAQMSTAIGKGFFNTRRNIQFLSEQTRGDSETWEISEDVRMGKDFNFGKWSITPSIIGRYSRTFVEDYDETGSAARLHIGEMDQQSAVSGATLTLQRAIPWNTMSFVPRLFVNYEREWVRSGVIDARFAAGGDAFRIKTDPIDPDQLTSGLGISFLFSKSFQSDFSVETETLQNDLQRKAVQLNFKFSF